MLNLGDTEVELHQLLKQIDCQPAEFNTGRLKHISLPQCPNKDARNTFETALTGVFGKIFTHSFIHTATSLPPSLSLSLTHTHSDSNHT